MPFYYCSTNSMYESLNSLHIPNIAHLRYSESRIYRNICTAEKTQEGPKFLNNPCHGLINYEDTKTKCRLYWCLIVYRLEIQSVMLVFSTQLCKLLPLLPYLLFTSPPLHPPSHMKDPVQYCR